MFSWVIWKKENKNMHVRFIYTTELVETETLCEWYWYFVILEQNLSRNGEVRKNSHTQRGQYWDREIDHFLGAYTSVSVSLAISIALGRLTFYVTLTLVQGWLEWKWSPDPYNKGHPESLPWESGIATGKLRKCCFMLLENISETYDVRTPGESV